jgi:hypothetical protein
LEVPLRVGTDLRQGNRAQPRRDMRLAAIPNDTTCFVKKHATADELREEVMCRLGELAEAGVIDLRASKKAITRNSW